MTDTSGTNDPALRAILARLLADALAEAKADMKVEVKKQVDEEMTELRLKNAELVRRGPHHGS